MSQVKDSSTQKTINHPIFSALYEWLFRGVAESYFMGPLRQDTAGKASGVVLEVGAGNGLNFPYYDPAKVVRVEATEPDAAMLGYARNHIKQARVPVHLTQAAAENLTFADATFDSAVVTLVFAWRSPVASTRSLTARGPSPSKERSFKRVGSARTRQRSACSRYSCSSRPRSIFLLPSAVHIKSFA